MENPPINALALLRGVVGMLAGGAVGCLLFWLLLQQGFYALVLPGALIGLGCGAFSRTRSGLLAAGSACVATVVTLGLEARFFPFVADPSMSYFVTHLHQLKSATVIMMAIGVFMAGWFGWGRR